MENLCKDSMESTSPFTLTTISREDLGFSSVVIFFIVNVDQCIFGQFFGRCCLKTAFFSGETSHHNLKILATEVHLENAMATVFHIS